MIFRTFDSDIDKWTAKIGIFGKSFHDLGVAINDAFTSAVDNIDNLDQNVGFWESLKNNLFNQNGKDFIKNALGEIVSKENIDSYIAELDLDSAKDELEKIFNFSSNIENGTSTWQDYFDTLDEGEKYIKDLIKNTDDLSKLEGQDLVDACNDAREAVIAHNEQLQNMSFKAKAGQLALKGLAVAANVLASIAINFVISKIHEAIQAQEKAREKAVELTNAYKEQQSSLDDQIKKYKELKQSLDEGNLSTDDARSIKEQLLEIQTSLVNSYGDEASGLDLVNGKYKEQLGLLGELSKEKAQDYVTENRDAFEDAKRELNKKRTYGFGPATVWSTASPITEEELKLLDYIENYSDLIKLMTINSGTYNGNSISSVFVSVEANAKEADELIHKFAEDVEKYANENGIDVSEMLNSISEQIDSVWTDELQEYQDIYDEFMKAEVIRNDTLRPLYQQSIDAVEAYNKALASGEGIEEAKANLDALKTSVQNVTGQLEESQAVFDDIFSKANEAAEAVGNVTSPPSSETPTLSDQLNGAKDSLDQFQSSVKSAYDAYSTLISGNYSSSELLDSIQAINQAMSDIGSSIDWTSMDGGGIPLAQLNETLERELKKYTENILETAGIDVGSDFGQMLANNIVQAQKATTQLEALNGQIDSLQSSYEDLT